MTVAIRGTASHDGSDGKLGNLLFMLVLFYWLSQTFLIPLIPIGPIWALWPTLSDIVVIAMFPLVLYRQRGQRHTLAVRSVVSMALILLCICSMSFLFAVWLYGADARSSGYGTYQLFRLAQFIVVALATASMALSQKHVVLFQRTSLFTFVLISSGVLLVATGIVETSLVTPLLPPSAEIAGPWAPYVRGMGASMGAGFIGFNHGYVAMHLLLSGGFAYWAFDKSRFWRLVICGLLVVATFATGSRGGFIAALILVLVCELRQKRSNLIILGIVFALAGIWLAESFVLRVFVERQTSAATSMHEDGLSGRTDIWQEYIDYFRSHPLNLVVGTGFGFALKASENNAHNLYLQVLTECGLTGLAAFLYLQIRTIRLLAGDRFRMMRLLVYLLLFVGLTQETLYPVVAFNQFLGFYLSALIVILRTSRDLHRKRTLQQKDPNPRPILSLQGYVGTA